MGRWADCRNHKMELAAFKHHFILIDFYNQSISKDPFVRNVFLFFGERESIKQLWLTRGAKACEPCQNLDGGGVCCRSQLSLPQCCGEVWRG